MRSCSLLGARALGASSAATHPAVPPVLALRLPRHQAGKAETAEECAARLEMESLASEERQRRDAVRAVGSLACYCGRPGAVICIASARRGRHRCGLCTCCSRRRQPQQRAGPALDRRRQLGSAPPIQAGGALQPTIARQTNTKTCARPDTFGTAAARRRYRASRCASGRSASSGTRTSTASRSTTSGARSCGWQRRAARAAAQQRGRAQGMGGCWHARLRPCLQRGMLHHAGSARRDARRARPPSAGGGAAQADRGAEPEPRARGGPQGRAGAGADVFGF